VACLVVHTACSSVLPHIPYAVLDKLVECDVFHFSSVCASGGNLGDPSFEEREEIGDNDDADTVCIFIDVVHKHVFIGYRLCRL
jgi:hypothetical protein